MNSKNIPVTYGLFTGLVIVVLSAAIMVSGLYINKYVNYVSGLPFIIGIILCCINYAKSMDGYVTFGQVFGKGLIAVLIIAAISTVWTIASFYLWPNMMDEMADRTRQELAKNPKMNEETINMTVNIMRKWMMPMAIFAASIGNVFMGCIFALIGAGIARKKGQRMGNLDAPYGPTNTNY